MNQNFTDSVTTALQEAFGEAQRRRNTEITENHLLWAFLKEKEGYFNSILTNLGTGPGSLLTEVEHNLDHLPTFSGDRVEAPSAARSLQSRITDANQIAQSMKDSYTGSDHFLLSYWKNGGEPFLSWKKRSQVSLSQVEEQIKK